MTLKEKIAGYIRETLKQEFQTEINNSPVNYTDNPGFGDYATPVCMGLAKEWKKNPREIAQTLADKMKQYKEFAKVEVAGPGFVNFFLSDGYIGKEIKTIAQSSDYGQNDVLKDRKILLEYVSANPTGPLHIGHGRWAAIGDSMARILRACGAEVQTEFYINDAGNQVELLRQSVQAVQENRPIPENGYHGEYIKEVAQMDGDPVDNFLSMQQQTLKQFKVEFDNYFSETTLHKSGYVLDTIEFLKQSGVTYEQDGALWFRTTDFGDDKDRVLIKADGAYTYFAVDIAYHRKKVQRQVNELINVFGADHHGYVNRLTAAVKVFSSDDVRLRIIIGQLVNLFRGGEAVRMSKRTGEMITLQEVMDEIGVDAARYFLVMRKTDTSLDFDLEVARKQSDDNPVFYVQYAHARISGVLRHAAENGAEADFQARGVIDCEEGRALALELIKFPEVLADVGNQLEPHRVPQYLENLATAFHRFYHHNRVVSEDKTATARRLVMVHATRNILRSGLSLIGVNAPERM